MAEAVIFSTLSKIISSVLSSAIISLGSLAASNVRDILEFRPKVEKTRINLGAVQSWLLDVEKKPRRNCLEANWVREIECVAYRAQDVMEKLLRLQWQHNGARGLTDEMQIYNHNREYYKALRDIGTEIDEINSLIPLISDITKNLSTLIPEDGNSMVSQCDNNQWSHDPRKPIDGHGNVEVVIGFDHQINAIMGKLIDQEHKQLRIVSIVGMGGIGKSTLAREIFNDLKVKLCFPIRIWIPISLQYDVQNIMKKIMKDVTQIKTEDFEKMTNGKQTAMLIEAVKDKRCLIVMDDIWETRFWDEISHDFSIFLNMDNGSRIIRTTRKLDVAKYPSNVETHIHEVAFLNDEASRDLFKRKAFPSYTKGIGPEKIRFENLVNELAKKCKGLPLAVCILGEYMFQHHDFHTWRRMLHSVDWEKIGNGKKMSKTLALSYHDLPIYLKPIFLHITSFPDSYEIRVSELIQLWIAEGFIPLSQHNILEETARNYVDELHERCLIQVVKRSRTHEWISRIRMHGVLRDWAIQKAEEERFLSVIQNSDHAPSNCANDSNRVAVHGYCINHLATSMPNLRTILAFGIPKKEVSLSGLNKPHILRVSSGVMTKELQCIAHMIFLKYICLRNCGHIEFPNSIGELYNLRTMDCKETTIKSLPSALWNISTLRHVYLKDICCDWNGPKKGLGKNLRSLFIHDRSKKSSFFKHTALIGIAEAFKEMAEISDLGLFTYAKLLPKDILSEISLLHSLEVLKLREELSALNSANSGLRAIPPGILPKSLVKIKLSCYNLTNDPMPVLGTLPNLVVLKLSNVTKLNSLYFCGFPELKSLTLIIFLGETLSADVGAMPVHTLRHLKLDGCTNLRTIPRYWREHDSIEKELANGTPASILACISSSVDCQKSEFGKINDVQLIGQNYLYVSLNSGTCCTVLH